MNKSIIFKLVTIFFIIFMTACDKNSTGVTSQELQNNEEIPKERTRESISKIIEQNLEPMQWAYNERLREKPGLKGKITCKFAIDEFGVVISCQVIESTINDPLLERKVVDNIKQLKFGKIDKPGDVVEAIFPFVFSQ